MSDAEKAELYLCELREFNSVSAHQYTSVFTASTEICTYHARYRLF